MNCYAVIDTNVLVSALLSGNEDAATVQVVARMLAGEITTVYSGTIMTEYRDVLSRPKFGFSPDVVGYLLSALEKYGMLVEAEPSGAVIPDMTDLPFYEDLVTGNIRHFPRQPFIVTPRQLMELLDARK